MLAAIHDQPTGQALACERAFLGALDGSCRTPIAGYARIEGSSLTFRGMILTPDGANSCDIEMDGPAADAAAIGRAAGDELKAGAGAALFQSWDQQNGFSRSLERA